MPLVPQCARRRGYDRPMAPPTVELYAWNPVRPLPTADGHLEHQPVNNFGDLLGPLIVTEILRRRGLSPDEAPLSRRLLSVGSVLHSAKAGDVVWGTGINGKVRNVRYRDWSLDVRAVRGPLTAQRLRRAGHEVPSVYGDPGSLMGLLWKREDFRRADLEVPVIVVPNFNDFADETTDAELLNPRSPLTHCLAAIASAELVVASSLHAIIVAEAFGVPAQRFKSRSEPDFKYEDYYQATGRTTHTCAATADEAIALGAASGTPRLDVTPLLEAFPWDLWEAPPEQATRGGPSPLDPSPMLPPSNV